MPEGWFAQPVAKTLTSSPSAQLSNLMTEGSYARVTSKLCMLTTLAATSSRVMVLLLLMMMVPAPERRPGWGSAEPALPDRG